MGSPPARTQWRPASYRIQKVDVRYAKALQFRSWRAPPFITGPVAEATGADVTVAVTIKDHIDRTIFSDSGLAEESETPYSLNEPLIGGFKVGVTLSADPLSDLAVIISLKGE